VDTTLIYSPEFATYRFAPGHPLRPERFMLAVELMRDWGLLAEDGAPATTDRARVAGADAASDGDISLAHSPALIAAVKAASADPADADASFGLGDGDTPAFRGMHRAAALAAGGTIEALESVLGSGPARAFSPAGGLHHAHRDRVAGFCVYNDCAIALARATAHRPDIRLAYVDIDAHHGDGVQEAFYERDDVLTISLHESGRYPYPGTGASRDVGDGPGFGYALNVPLPPFADEECYAAALEQVVAPALAAFQPEAVVLQLGGDSHRDDPLTQLGLTVVGYHRTVRRLVAIADAACGRIAATGGGGYQPYSAVPRMWACAMAVLLDIEPPETLPAEWLARAAATARAAGEPAPNAGGTFDEPHDPPAYAAIESVLGLTQHAIEQTRAASPLLGGGA